MHDVWIVGRWIDPPTEVGWTLEGVYPTRERAIEEAETGWGWFIASMPFDTPGPPGVEIFPDYEWTVELADA